jgi:hypothetical protein
MRPVISRIVAVAAAALAVVSCKTVTTERVTFPNTPVAYQLVSDMVDEETLEHTVKFRNVGTSIISFDYTISDEPGVPHTDAEGPNSGVIENLYPGAEASVKNPIQDEDGVYVVLGKVVHGRKAADEITRTFKPNAAKTAAAASTESAVGALPLLEPVAAP